MAPVSIYRASLVIINRHGHFVNFFLACIVKYLIYQMIREMQLIHVILEIDSTHIVNMTHN